MCLQNLRNLHHCLFKILKKNQNVTDGRKEKRMDNMKTVYPPPHTHKHSLRGYKDKQCSGTDNAAIADFIFCYSTNQSFKQPNYKSHKKNLAPAPSSFFQFLYYLKINFLQIVLMGEGFPALFFAFGWCCCWGKILRVYLMYSLYKGGLGVLPWKILENLECGKSHLPHFWGLCFIFLFFINQFSLFFLLFFKIFRLFFIF